MDILFINNDFHLNFSEKKQCFNALAMYLFFSSLPKPATLRV